MKSNFLYLAFLFFAVFFSSCSEEQIEEKDINESRIEQEQTKKTYCTVDEIQKIALKKNPQLKSIIQQSNDKIAEIINSDEFKKSKNNIITIPVVFNIIKPIKESSWQDDWHTIERSQIIGQLNTLNRFFTQKGPRINNLPNQFAKLRGNPRIKFVLKKIQRTTVKKSWRVFNDEMKDSATDGIDAFKPNKYVNIWVCNIHYAGSAYKPGMAPSKKYDGILIDYRYFGINPRNLSDYNQGKTLVHEMGHYFNLDHPFLGSCGSGDDDHVADTPKMTEPNPRRGEFLCEGIPNRNTCGSLDMTMNLMSYAHDECLTIFTKGQVTRMRATLAPGGPRAGMIE
ncbi:M43 family zinc metalloprotease [Aquimarina sp. Aq78]|uniref:M43 family zinc metalloprotease n=1 Tax=Aquimarina sp. Aq78 TaxID=1191889 RepID=UPI000D0E5D19|nr:M43 family zinc metalloprotease [Aquimarina sp. Aq78]